MVEESTPAARNPAAEADALAGRVARFRPDVGDRGGAVREPASMQIMLPPRAVVPLRRPEMRG